MDEFGVVDFMAEFPFLPLLHAQNTILQQGKTYVLRIILWVFPRWRRVVKRNITRLARTAFDRATLASYERSALTLWDSLARLFDDQRQVDPDSIRHS